MTARFAKSEFLINYGPNNSTPYAEAAHVSRILITPTMPTVAHDLDTVAGRVDAQLNLSDAPASTSFKYAPLTPAAIKALNRAGIFTYYDAYRAPQAALGNDEFEPGRCIENIRGLSAKSLEALRDNLDGFLSDYRDSVEAARPMKVAACAAEVDEVSEDVEDEDDDTGSDGWIWAGMAYSHRGAMLDAMARSWIGAGGDPTIATCDEVLADWDVSAGEIENEWDVKSTAGYDRADFKAAVERLREELTTRRIMVTVRPDASDDDEEIADDGIVSNEEYVVADEPALKALVLKLSTSALADLLVDGNAGSYRVMVIDYTSDDDGEDMFDQVFVVPETREDELSAEDAEEQASTAHTADRVQEHDDAEAAAEAARDAYYEDALAAGATSGAYNEVGFDFDAEGNVVESGSDAAVAHVQVTFPQHGDVNAVVLPNAEDCESFIYQTDNHYSDADLERIPEPVALADAREAFDAWQSEHEDDAEGRADTEAAADFEYQAYGRDDED